jgi:aspartate racemase
MKKIGIVGGVSWLSTVEYYSGICRLAEQAHLAAGLGGVPAVPEIVIESLDLRRAVAAIGSDPDEESWREFDAYHAEALGRLEGSGADFALIASNSPHHRFSAITRGIGIPVLNLFDELAAEAGRNGSGDVLVLGTALTMGSAALGEAFRRRGIHATGPSDPSARLATTRLIEDIQGGGDAASLGRLEAIVARELDARPGRKPMICLACTELPLVFGDSKGASSFEHGGLTFIDSTRVHIEAAYRVATGERNPG